MARSSEDSPRQQPSHDIVEAARTRVNKAYGAARNRAEQLSADGRRIAHDALANGRDRADAAYRAGRDRADQLIESGKQSARALPGKTADGIERNPLLALAGAVTLGLFAGLMLPKSR